MITSSIMNSSLKRILLGSSNMTKSLFASKFFIKKFRKICYYSTLWSFGFGGFQMHQIARNNQYFHLPQDFSWEESKHNVVSAVSLLVARILYYLETNVNSSNILYGWITWLESLSNDPMTLLRLTESDDESTRNIGITSLVSPHHWDDDDYNQILQKIDKNILISLARYENVSSKYFQKSFHCNLSKADVFHQLNEFLIIEADLIDNSVIKQMLKQFLFNTDKFREDLSNFDNENILYNNYDFVEQKPEISCVKALLLLSFNPEYSKRLVEKNILSLLQKVIDDEDLNISRAVAHIMSNLSYHEWLSYYIDIEWISQLYKWLRCDDLALNLYACKALINLDQCEEYKYDENLYIYHPIYKTSEKLDADIVFFHGLRGGVLRTWRQCDSARIKSEISDKTYRIKSFFNRYLRKTSADTNDILSEPSVFDFNEHYSKCWPKDWLTSDCPNARIIAVEYETKLSEWPSSTNYIHYNQTISSISDDLSHKLFNVGIGSKPLVWVGHSMGGLLIKNIITSCVNSDFENILQNTRGAVFFSVPHFGSAIPDIMKKAKYIFYPSIEVKELSQGSPFLISLNEQFCDIVNSNDISILSFCESTKTIVPYINMKFMIVPTDSSNLNLGEFHILENLNHLNICKPKSKNTFLYKRTSEFIKDLIQHISEVEMTESLENDFHETVISLYY